MDVAHTAHAGDVFFSRGEADVAETMVEDSAVRKASLRDELSLRRKGMAQDQLDSKGLKVQSRFLATPYYGKARTVALYAPIRGEVPTRDILTAALADGK